MKYKDMCALVDLLDKEWDLGKKEANVSSKICAWIYLMEILEETEQFVYYKENNKLLGIVGYSNKASKRGKFKKKIYNIIKRILFYSKDIKNVDALKEYYKNYDYVPIELKNYFDGEISILIVDKEMRNKGIGKKLLIEIFKLAKKDNMKNLQILTDESCNYHIYEKMGCKKVYETIVRNMELKPNSNCEKVYIFEKTL